MLFKSVETILLKSIVAIRPVLMLEYYIVYVSKVQFLYTSKE